jgi:hypothetical protein
MGTNDLASFFLEIFQTEIKFLWWRKNLSFYLASFFGKLKVVCSMHKCHRHIYIHNSHFVTLGGTFNFICPLLFP